MDVEGVVTLVHRAEQSAEVVPDRPRVVGVAMLVGLLDGVRRQQVAVLAEGAEQDAVEQLLRALQDDVAVDGGVFS